MKSPNLTLIIKHVEDLTNPILKKKLNPKPIKNNKSKNSIEEYNLRIWNF